MLPGLSYDYAAGLSLISTNRRLRYVSQEEGEVRFRLLVERAHQGVIDADLRLERPRHRAAGGGTRRRRDGPSPEEWPDP